MWASLQQINFALEVFFQENSNIGRFHKTRLHFYKNINITIRSLCPLDKRTEQTNTLNTHFLQGRLVLA